MARTLLVSAAFALALLSTFIHALSADAPCPHYVQGVLLSRQYDNCLTHLLAHETADASPSKLIFSATNAHAIHANADCSHALDELLAVAPPSPCTAQLSKNERVLVEAPLLQWIASHPLSRQLTVSRRLGPGGSMYYHVPYSCHFQTKQPFNADTDFTENFTVLCRENLLVEYPNFWTWLGYIVLGLVLVVGLVAGVVWGMKRYKESRRKPVFELGRVIE